VDGWRDRLILRFEVHHSAETIRGFFGVVGEAAEFFEDVGPEENIGGFEGVVHGEQFLDEQELGFVGLPFGVFGFGDKVEYAFDWRGAEVRLEQGGKLVHDVVQPFAHADDGVDEGQDIAGEFGGHGEVLDGEPGGDVLDGVGHVVLEFQVGEQIAPKDGQGESHGNGLADFVFDDVGLVLGFAHFVGQGFELIVFAVADAFEHRVDDRDALFDLVEVLGDRCEGVLLEAVDHVHNRFSV